ncbi:MAG: xanthine dehydrogenase [Rhizomicrobium sp.]
MTCIEENNGDERQPRPSVRGLAVILGTNEIASAAGVYLHRAGWGVVLSHDPYPPVIRRRMAFYDALFGDKTSVDGVMGTYAEHSMDVRAAIAEAGKVAVTPRDFLDLLTIERIDVLVDARMQKYVVKPDLRWLSGTSLGLGPGFDAGRNCDIAIETHPSDTGAILRGGRTADPDRAPVPLGNVGSERFVYTIDAGRWHTPIEIGTRVFKGFVLGHLDGLPVRAPFDGRIRGIARDGLTIPAGVKLAEIDPRRRGAKWTGIDPRGHAIGEAVTSAIHAFARQRVLSD